MSESEIMKIADNANMIVHGYAFTQYGDFVRVLNLNNTDSAAVIGYRDEIIETTMDDDELEFVKNTYSLNKKFMNCLEDYSA